MSEPLSSSLFDSLPADHAGAASSDFQGESLPPDAGAEEPSVGSLTSREEVFSVSEVEVKHTRRQIVKGKNLLVIGSKLFDSYNVL